MSPDNEFALATPSLVACAANPQPRLISSKPPISRQIGFVRYVNTTATLRKKAKSVGDGGTVMSGASGSSKGTQATNVSDVSNLSGTSDGGASVFSQRSAATKSTSSGSSAGVAVGKTTTDGVPSAAIEGSAFVIPAQEVCHLA